MVDGEVLERLWSYLSQYRKMTKEMSASHREDIISDALFYFGKKQRSRVG
jgi:ribosomal protein L20A (L18A)